jgi:hypothetical protein
MTEQCGDNNRSNIAKPSNRLILLLEKKSCCTSALCHPTPIQNEMNRCSKRTLEENNKWLPPPPQRSCLVQSNELIFVVVVYLIELMKG